MEYISEAIKERLLNFWINFRAEIILIGISLVIFLSSLIVFVIQVRQKSVQPSLDSQVQYTTPKVEEKFIYVDIAGAVEYPDVYKLSQGARLKYLVDKAGGLSTQADLDQIAQDMNMAAILSDQQKVYIPQIGDNVQLVESEQLYSATAKLSLNRATSDELNSLDGVGDVTARKIIAARPYKALSDLLSRKIVSKGLYDKIKDLIVL